MKRRTLAGLLALLCVWLGGCAGEEEPMTQLPNPVVTIEMQDGEIIRLELYPNIALNTVSNFVNLIQQGFYNGLLFHRVDAGFLIQGGDPQGNGTGGPGYTIPGEFAKNGFENTLRFTRGVVGMARGKDYDSAGSQFFILHANATYLDGEWAAFGKVMDEESMAVVDIIANTPADINEKPLVDWRIKTMTVDTFGYQYEVIKTEEE